MNSAVHTCNEVLRALRKIIRATDLNSKKLSKTYNLTTPQLIVLKDLSDHGSSPVGNLAKRISLSHATVTEIIDRLEKKGYVKRIKHQADKRKVFVSLEAKANELINQKPATIQEQFVERFSQLPDWEQNLILSSFQKVVFLMNAEKIDASPILLSTAILEE